VSLRVCLSIVMIIEMRFLFSLGLAFLLLNPGFARAAQPLEAFLPDPEIDARLRPIIADLESESFPEREAASLALRSLPALPGMVREQAVREERPETRTRLQQLVAAFPLEAENQHLTGILRQIESKSIKGQFDPLIRVVRRGVWSPENDALHGAARATATRDDLPAISRCAKDPMPPIRRVAAAALGGLTAGDVNQALTDLLTDPDDATAILAAAALARRKDPRCLPAYARLLDAADFQFRYQAHSALRGLTGKDFGYDPSATEVMRAGAAGKWRKWAASPKAAITGSLPRDTSIALFNGRNLQGWEVVTGGKPLVKSSAWAAKDGLLHCNGGEIGDLWTTTRHRSFVLTMEYLMPAEGVDSGVGLLLTEEQERGPNGPGYLEVQTLPGRAGDLYQIGDIKVETPKGPIQFNSPRTAETADPAGRWQRLKLSVRDGAVDVEINGVLVNRVIKGPRGPGRILLRNEGNPVSFRSILLSSLDPLP
jgi:hypothetical protein